MTTRSRQQLSSILAIVSIIALMVLLIFLWSAVRNDVFETETNHIPQHYGRHHPHHHGHHRTQGEFKEKNIFKQMTTIYQIDFDFVRFGCFAYHQNFVSFVVWHLCSTCSRSIANVFWHRRWQSTDREVVFCLSRFLFCPRRCRRLTATSSVEARLKKQRLRLQNPTNRKSFFFVFVSIFSMRWACVSKLSFSWWNELRKWIWDNFASIEIVIAHHSLKLSFYSWKETHIHFLFRLFRLVAKLSQFFALITFFNWVNNHKKKYEAKRSMLVHKRLYSISLFFSSTFLAFYLLQ